MKGREREPRRKLGQSAADSLRKIELRLDSNAGFFHQKRLKKGVLKGFPDALVSEMGHQMADGVGGVRKRLEKLSGK